MNKYLNSIDPLQSNIPELAIIQQVISENDRLSSEQHDEAVKAFVISDGIASGIGRDLVFVDKIPQFIKEIMEQKLWECLFVAKGVVTPYYCRYTKGTDAENFRAFITAKRPNGLETSVDILRRVLKAEPEVLRKFDAIVLESSQGKRTDLLDETSGSDCLKLDLSERQQKNIRAANRAAEAIPVIKELLDRGLIAIDLAAKLGHDIKDPNNLTAEEREYVDKRDLIGLRINQYINTNTIPDDEDKEPAYRRQLNEYVKDLLGIKDRSRSVRMDNPKKAAEKLLEFYQGDKLQELINYLHQGNNINFTQVNNDNNVIVDDFDNEIPSDLQPNFVSQNITQNGNHSYDNEKKVVDLPRLNPAKDVIDNYKIPPQQLKGEELAERLQVKPRTLAVTFCQYPDKFSQWSQKKDPDGIPWQRSEEKIGRSWLYIPVTTDKNST